MFCAGIVLLFLISFSKYTEQCTERFMELPLVTYRAEQINTDAVGDALSNTLRVLQEYQFSCSTNITSLILGIDIREATNTRTLYPSIQVFRPNGSLVTGSERTIYYSTSNVSTSGVFEYPLNPPIPVMGGDLLAVSQPPQGNSVVRVYYISGITANSQEFNYGDININLAGNPTTDELILVYPVTDGYCVNSTNSITPSVIRNNFLTIQSSAAIDGRRLYLYPEIVFSCNGSLTKWIYGGEGIFTMESGQHELQIWRQLGPNNYNKIGSSLVNASTMIGTNLYEFIPQTLLQFQEGDIFGVHIFHLIQGVLSLYEQVGNGPLNEQINDFADSPLSTITQALVTDSNNNFPLVTVEVSNSVTSTSVATSTSTSPVISTTSIRTTSTVLTTAIISTTNNTIISSTMVSITLSSDSSVLVTITPNSSVTTVTLSSSVATDTTPVSSTVIITTAPSDSSVSSTTVTSAAPSSTSVMTTTSSSSSMTNTTSTSSATSIFSSTSMMTNVPSNSSSSTIPPNTVGTSTPSSSSIDSISSSSPIVTPSLTMSSSVFSNPSTGSSASTVIAIVISMLVLFIAISVAFIIVSMFAIKKRKKRYLGRVPLLPASDDSTSALHTSIRDLSVNYSVYEDVDQLPGLVTNDRFHETHETAPEIPQKASRSSVSNPLYDDKSFEKVPTVATPAYETLEAPPINDQSATPLSKGNKEPDYWAPGDDTSSIYQQMESKGYKQLKRNDIKVINELGSGEFGTVYKGTWFSKPVAIKTLKNSSVEQDKVKFLQEAAIMGQFHHPNIVKLHGMVTVGEPLMIVLELIPHGDMRHYLHTLQPQPGELVASTVPGLLLSFCRQIASGMEYLSKKGFVHRDLAARNILMTDHGMCKIADFGMSRDLHDENYYVSTAKMIPVKWTSPEALKFKRYSSASDVWSYGVVMYEIWSLGHKPFENFSNQEYVKLIDTGYRLPPPPGCPRPVYKIMIQCWHPKTSGRPTFADIVSRFGSSDIKKLSEVVEREGTALGGSLESAHDSYTDLQNTYIL
ncbi:PREDICTED: probable serine/threonine-protein kinase dyrk2 isoform X2 [Amphimedon queenslandica]|uniref:Protein kinase domain-containing protein n=1 Tax=Amphimedon queenslandica TaxID=400682 RepID=A0AAN0IXK8_AMPQE|nr:PREDICTED: probable serine/threonine-protein kinase dyrk2 isoform X2 [Amphimedon queenslandica]|eukprot:XP_019849282.1 PREDICTED: probable serine/threonine-protein kinase dyrk2 isoform X2 [Amphimedon queenslandica]